jgi:hypothetical protein
MIMNEGVEMIGWSAHEREVEVANRRTLTLIGVIRPKPVTFLPKLMGADAQDHEDELAKLVDVKKRCTTASSAGALALAEHLLNLTLKRLAYIDWWEHAGDGLQPHEDVEDPRGDDPVAFCAATHARAAAWPWRAHPQG